MLRKMDHIIISIPLQIIIDTWNRLEKIMAPMETAINIPIEIVISNPVEYPTHVDQH